MWSRRNICCRRVGSWGMGSQITANSYNFDVVKEFIYIGTDINTNNDVTLETKRRVTPANRCYFGLIRQLSSRDLSSATTVSEPTSSCISSSMKWTLLSVLIFSGSAGSAMSFGWRRRSSETSVSWGGRRTRWIDLVEEVVTSHGVINCWSRRTPSRCAWKEGTLNFDNRVVMAR